ncbi:hypothetical protein WH7805_11888 [Synechococcus sp. WH 7805]|nr:hypothetical protein WH7805_11888 [Synechococcus sp. WH 7805]
MLRLSLTNSGEVNRTLFSGECFQQFLERNVRRLWAESNGDSPEAIANTCSGQARARKGA